MKIIKLTKGEQVGECIFLKDLGSVFLGKVRKRICLFKCSCGKEFENRYLSVKSGNTKSCGCRRLIVNKISKEFNLIHGKRYHELYSTWNNMQQRCYNPRNHAYHNYGGRGITVCDRWLNINNFIEDMYSSYSFKKQLDRINNNLGYYKDNCRWASVKENCNNTRTNRILNFNNKSMTISEWADFLDIPYTTLSARLNKLKWSEEKALSTPFFKKRIK